MNVYMNTMATYVNLFDFCFYDVVDILNVLQPLFLAFAFFLLHWVCLNELHFFVSCRAVGRSVVAAAATATAA